LTSCPELLEPYGPNVATAEGSDYRFHVRITAPPFSDISGVNSLVWDETVKQTSLLIEHWGALPPGSLQDEINALTLAVIAVAGFGKPIDSVSGQKSSPPDGYAITFLRAISDTTKYIVAILLFPGWLLRMTPLSKADLARRELDRYLREMIRAQRKVLENGTSAHTLATAGPRGNLLHAVIKASYDEAQLQQKTARDAGSAVRHAFTEDEVMGNLFIYLLAGNNSMDAEPIDLS
jgi:cytochrome P450